MRENLVQNTLYSTIKRQWPTLCSYDTCVIVCPCAAHYDQFLSIYQSWWIFQLAAKETVIYPICIFLASQHMNQLSVRSKQMETPKTYHIDLLQQSPLKCFMLWYLYCTLVNEHSFQKVNSMCLMMVFWFQCYHFRKILCVL